MSRILILLESMSDYEQCSQLGRWILNLQQYGHEIHVRALTDRDAYDTLLPQCDCKALLREERFCTPFLDSLSGRLLKLWTDSKRLMMAHLPPFLLRHMYLRGSYDIWATDQCSLCLHILGSVPAPAKKIGLIFHEPREYTPELLKYYQRFDQILCLSESLREDFCRYFFRSSRVQLLPAGGQAVPARRIIAFSTFLPGRMFPLLLSAVCRLHSQNTNCELLLIGHHPLENEYQTLLQAAHAVIMPAGSGTAMTIAGGDAAVCLQNREEGLRAAMALSSCGIPVILPSYVSLRNPSRYPNFHCLDSVTEDTLFRAIQKVLQHPLLQKNGQPLPASAATRQPLEDISHEIYNLSP